MIFPTVNSPDHQKGLASDWFLGHWLPLRWSLVRFSIFPAARQTGPLCKGFSGAQGVGTTNGDELALKLFPIFPHPSGCSKHLQLHVLSEILGTVLGDSQNNAKNFGPKQKPCFM